MREEYKILGIDLGGSNIRCGIVNASGELTHWHHEAVDQSISGEQLVELIARFVEPIDYLGDVKSIAIGLAGMILHNQVLKTDLLTLPKLGDYPLTEKVSDRLQKPCWVGNDADCALRGEVHFGAAKGHSNVLLLTLGTGIGGGLLLNGKLREGPHGSSVEIGPMLIGDPLERPFKSIESCYSPGSIMKHLNHERGYLFDRIRQGDQQAVQLLLEMNQALGVLITNIHLLLDLELVLISGGLAAAGEDLITGLKREFLRTCPPIYQFDMEIQLGALPVNTAGVIGAACYWLEQYGVLPPL